MAAPVAHRVLDVSRLEPPEPLVRILDALEALPPGGILQVRHRREPFPLYAILEEIGYAWYTRRRAAHDYEIFIWRRDDEPARASAQALIGSEAKAAQACTADGPQEGMANGQD